jgi:hypothetical protein
MKLKDVLPYEFISAEYDNCRARKFADVEVVKEWDSRDNRWIGKHKNVTYWYELENGYAIGINENPARGLSFPVKRIKQLNVME